MASAHALPLPEEVHYPDSDGQPMAESDPHRDEMTYLVETLRDHFRGQKDVYVTGNLFLYYRKGDPSACVAPDLFVVRGVAPRRRRRYLLWEEGVAPCLVIEVTSASTHREDDEKKDLYARLGVEEYFRFDPEGDYLRPRLQGFRRRGDRYRRLRPAADGSLRSRSLGLSLTVEGTRLRVLETVTGKRLLRFEEHSAGRRTAEGEVVLHAARAAEQAILAAQERSARRNAEERAAEADAARRAAEERSARLEDELARLRLELGRDVSTSRNEEP